MGLSDRETQVIGRFISNVVNTLEEDKINDKNLVSGTKIKDILENHMLNNAVINKNQIVSLSE